MKIYKLDEYFDGALWDTRYFQKKKTMDKYIRSQYILYLGTEDPHADRTMSYREFLDSGEFEIQKVEVE